MGEKIGCGDRAAREDLSKRPLPLGRLQLMYQVVFAYPSNKTRDVCAADSFEQLGYLAESAIGEMLPL